MKPENYDKIKKLMEQRAVLSGELFALNNDRPYVAVKYDGRPETEMFFGKWASKYKTASPSEQCTAKYISELKDALAFEIGHIDGQLAKL